MLLYDERGNLKCETCFQCAQACPIEIIDMGGVDTKNRFHVHWGPAEQYAERREESALRRSGRPVPDRSCSTPGCRSTLGPSSAILVANDYDPHRLLAILEATQDAYGHLPVAALQHISHSTGAWYSEIYGIATSYPQPRLRARPRVGDRPVPLRDVRAARRAAASATRSSRRWARTSAASLPTAQVRFVAADCGGESRDEPLVTLDGQTQPGMTADKARDAGREAARQGARRARPSGGAMNILAHAQGRAHAS